MTEIPPTSSIAVVGAIRPRRIGGKERAELRLVLAVQAKRIENSDLGRGFAFQPKERVQPLAGKRYRHLERPISIQSWRTEHKWPVVPAGFGKRQTLKRTIVVTALVQERLD